MGVPSVLIHFIIGFSLPSSRATPYEWKHPNILKNRRLALKMACFPKHGLVFFRVSSVGSITQKDWSKLHNDLKIGEFNNGLICFNNGLILKRTKSAESEKLWPLLLAVVSAMSFPHEFPSATNPMGPPKICSSASSLDEVLHPRHPQVLGKPHKPEIQITNRRRKKNWEEARLRAPQKWLVYTIFIPPNLRNI
jgi:hypothetical protein